MQIHNDFELQAYLNSVANQVINIVTGKVHMMLVEYIMKYTYEYGGLPNMDYYDESGYPTYEFMDSWFSEKIKTTLDSVIYRVAQDWQGMSYDPDTFLHGSKYTGDVRKQLADILNVDGVSGGDFSGGENSKPRRAYFNLLLKDLNDGEMFKMLDEEFAKFGFFRRTII